MCLTGTSGRTMRAGNGMKEIQFNCITVGNQAPRVEPIHESERFQKAMRDCI